MEKRLNLFKKTIENLNYMEKIDNNRQTLYDAVRWSYFRGICEDMLLQYEVLEEKFNNLSERIAIELQRYQKQEEF